MKVILASASPRRREIMNLTGIPYEVIPSNYEEVKEGDISKGELVKKLGQGKAEEVFNRTSGDRIVIGCDTLVYKDDNFYGKPKTEDEAKQMVQELQDDWNEVYSGFAILVEKDGKQEKYIDYDVSRVHIVDMTEKEIENWVATGDAMDKAGAYAMQGKFGVYVDKIEGSYYNVIGFPIHKIYRILKKYQ